MTRGGDRPEKVMTRVNQATSCNEEATSIPPPFSAALVAGASHDRQDVEENVDDVSVEVEGSKDVLLRAQRKLLVAQEELSVNCQKLQRIGENWTKVLSSVTVYRAAALDLDLRQVLLLG